MGLWSIVVPYASKNYVAISGVEQMGGWTPQPELGWVYTRVHEKVRHGKWAWNFSAAAGQDYYLYETSDSSFSNTTVTVSAWVRVDTFLGGAYQNRGLYATWGTQTLDIKITGVTPGWVRLSGSMTYSGSGYVQVRIYAPQASIFWDSVQIEVGPLTDFIDRTLPGCIFPIADGYWAERLATTRIGGRQINFDDLSFYIESSAGAGSPVIDLFSQPRAVLPGSSYDGYAIRNRPLILTGVLIGSSLSDLHTKRKALFDALRADNVPGSEPILLRYNISSTWNCPIEIPVYFEGGMEFQGRDGFTERIALRFRSFDPFAKDIGNQGDQLDSSANLSTGYLFMRDGIASPGAATLWRSVSANAQVIGVAFFPKFPIRYIVGEFTTLGGVTVNRVAHVSSTGTVSAYGVGLNGIARACGVAPQNGYLYVTGDFTQAGGGSANRIAKVIHSGGTVWTALSTGLNAPGHAIAIPAIAFTASVENIYVGGEFTTAGAVTVNGVAMWNEVSDTWSALGATPGVAGGGADVFALVFGSDGKLYVGGDFTSAGGVTANRIAVWDPETSTWSTLGVGFNGTVRCLCFDEKGWLYAGGDFTTAGGVTANRIAVWNGVVWKPLGTGAPENSVKGVAYNPINKLLYAAGTFRSMGGALYSDAIAVWNGYSWRHIDAEFYTSNPDGFNGIGCSSLNGDLVLCSTDARVPKVSLLETVNSPGTARAFPKFVFIGDNDSGVDLSVRYIENMTTGKIIWMSHTLGSEDELTVDCTPGSQRVYTSSGDNALRSVLKGSSFSDFYLQPGDNVINLFVHEATNSSADSFVLHTPTFWGIDGVRF